MAELTSFAREILATARMVTDSHVVFTVLHQMRQLYEVELHEDVMRLVQSLTPPEFLNAVHSASTLKHPQVGTAMGKINEFYRSHDSVTTTKVEGILLFPETLQCDRVVCLVTSVIA